MSDIAHSDGIDRCASLRRAADRAASVARGGGKDGKRWAIGAEPVEAGHEEPRPEILERAGRPMKQLECLEGRPFRIGSCERRRKIESLRANFPQLMFEPVAGKKWLKKLRCKVGERSMRFELPPVGNGNGLRHVEAAVWRSPAEQHLANRIRHTGSARTNEPHADSASPTRSTRTPAEATGAR